jgi:hypothetical protein
MPVLSEVEVNAQFGPRQRGGRRPGAGAPRGNLNALKHGETSRQIEQLGFALSLIPETRKALIRLMKRQRRQQAQARTVAVKLLSSLLQACLQTLDTPPDDASPPLSGNNQAKNGFVTIYPDTRRPSRRRRSRKINQSPQSKLPAQSNPPVGQGTSPAAS